MRAEDVSKLVHQACLSLEDEIRAEYENRLSRASAEVERLQQINHAHRKQIKLLKQKYDELLQSLLHSSSHSDRLSDNSQHLPTGIDPIIQDDDEVNLPSEQGLENSRVPYIDSNKRVDFEAHGYLYQGEENLDETMLIHVPTAMPEHSEMGQETRQPPSSSSSKVVSIQTSNRNVKSSEIEVGFSSRQPAELSSCRAGGKPNLIDHDINEPIPIRSAIPIPLNITANTFKSPAAENRLEGVSSSQTSDGACTITSSQASPILTLYQLEKFEEVAVNPRPERTSSLVNDRPRKLVRYEEVVRGHEQRLELPGFACDECKRFYDAMVEQGVILPDDRKEALQLCSRHKARYTPPETPEDFWNLDIATPAEWKAQALRQQQPKA
jgi:hypothetical protein